MSYQPTKGEEAYVHVNVTQKGGQAITPKIELYHPQLVAAVMGLKGFNGEIVYDPRTADQKRQEAPANDTVKAADPLSGADSYRVRYKQLFHEDAPFNLHADEVKRIVDRAETHLAEAFKGISPVEPEPERQEEDDADLPSNKTEWFVLFQKTFPEDATAYADITVPLIRERLNK